MRIDSVEAIPSGSACYVRVVADDGTSGVGESTFFGWPTAVAEIVRSFGEYLRGLDTFDVEHHWLAQYRTLSFRGMAVSGAISAVDQALWDIKGKHFEVPVWQLLGGRARRAVRAMKVIDTGTADQVVEGARRAVEEEGYGALKILLFQNEHHLMRQAARIEDLVDRFAAVRSAVGWQVDLGVELHRNMTAGDAVLLSGELKRFRPLFVEDPIPPDSVEALRAFAARVDLPVAAGERNTTIWEFAEYLERPGVAYIRPDVGIAGGITHVKKICALAEAFHAGIIPHAVPSGPVAVAAHVQLGMCVPNWELQEHVPQNLPRWTDLVDQVIEVRDGYLLAPDRPGLGIELVDAGLAEYPPVSADLFAPLSSRRRFGGHPLTGTSNALSCRNRLRVGLACNDYVRTHFVDPADLVRLESAAEFSYRSFSVASVLGSPAPRDPEAEAELSAFVADKDVLVVCHGAPFVSSAVLAASAHLTLLGELEGDRFGYSLDLAAATSEGFESSTLRTGHRGPAPNGLSVSLLWDCETLELFFVA